MFAAPSKAGGMQGTVQAVYGADRGRQDWLSLPTAHPRQHAQVSTGGLQDEACSQIPGGGEGTLWPWLPRLLLVAVPTSGVHQH